MSIQVLVGADPEVFMFKEGKPVSAHGMIQGNKKNPYKVEKGAVQVDGMALEFNIDPAGSREEFINNIDVVMNTLRSMVPDYELVAAPVAEFGLDYIKSQPAEAIELGCEPDYNAYTGLANERPNAEVDFRTGAGHIHIGWTKDQDPLHPEHLEACRMLVRELDASLAIGSMLFDKDTKRRTLYGDLGAFRPKSYGVEYRVLSNAWVPHAAIRGWIYDTVQEAFNRLVDGGGITKSQERLVKRMFHLGSPELAFNKVGYGPKELLAYLGYETMPPAV